MLLEEQELIASTNNPTRMVHLVYLDQEDQLTAICGAPLLGIPADDKDLDCVVCAEIDAQEEAEWDEQENT
jgi:hypothetical protein